MIYWKEYKKHDYELEGKRNKIDTTIYTFDIETTSIIIMANDHIRSAIEYESLTEQEKKDCDKIRFYVHLDVFN